MSSIQYPTDIPRGLPRPFCGVVESGGPRGKGAHGGTEQKQQSCHRELAISRDIIERSSNTFRRDILELGPFKKGRDGPIYRRALRNPSWQRCLALTRIAKSDLSYLRCRCLRACQHYLRTACLWNVFSTPIHNRQSNDNESDPQDHQQ